MPGVGAFGRVPCHWSKDRHHAGGLGQDCNPAGDTDLWSHRLLRELRWGALSFSGLVANTKICLQIGVQQGADIATLPLADFRRFLDVNTTGMFLVTREASRAMRSQEPRPVSSESPKRGTTRGAIVNLASVMSVVAAPEVIPYTASKHAVLGLTKNAALDNVSHGIRVNCVCPSWVDTPMVQQAEEGVQGLTQFIQSVVPMGRIATPEEIADTVIFLASPRSSYVTGCGFIVDGGTTLTALR